MEIGECAPEGSEKRSDWATTSDKCNFPLLRSVDSDSPPSVKGALVKNSILNLES